MSVQYICDGAIIQCTYGSSMTKLRVFPNRTVTLTEGNYGNISDHNSMKNIPPFGLCSSLRYPRTKAATDANHGSLTPRPCEPGTMQLWEGGNDSYLVRNYPALQSNSYCKCIYGGIIKFVNNGQQSEQFTIESIPAMQKEDVLDQADKIGNNGLDVVDFIPVVGSIRDIGEGIATGSKVLILIGVAGLALDVFTGGAGSVAKGAVKGTIKSSIKSLGKSATKEIAEESVENFVKNEVKHTANLLGPTFKSKVAEYEIKEATESVVKEITEESTNNILKIDAEIAETGAKEMSQLPKIEIQEVLKKTSTIIKGELEKISPFVHDIVKIGKGIGDTMIEGTKIVIRDIKNDDMIVFYKNLFENINKLNKYK